jgi:hypothetical protein
LDPPSEKDPGGKPARRIDGLRTSIKAVVVANYAGVAVGTASHVLNSPTENRSGKASP